MLYGDNALAAVIEIATVDGRPDVSLDLSAGTPEQWGATGRVSRTKGPWSFAAAATSYSTAGYSLPGSFLPTSTENGGRRENSDRDRDDLRGSLAYRVSPSVALGTEWSFGTGSYGLPPGTINDAADIFAQAIRYERVEDYDAASGQASVTIAPGSRFNLRGWVYRNTQREDRTRYDDGTYSSMDDPLVQGTFESHERTTVTGSIRPGADQPAAFRLAAPGREPAARGVRCERHDSRRVGGRRGWWRWRGGGGGGGGAEVAAAVRPRSTSARSRWTSTSTSIPPAPSGSSGRRASSGRCWDRR